MIDSLSGQPEPRALEIITAALKSAQQMGEQGDWAFDETDSDNLLRDLTAAFLAAGWLPPEALEQVGSVLDDGDEVHDFRYSSPDDQRLPAAAFRDRVPVYRFRDGLESHE